jgi:hypothetical protein
MGGVAIARMNMRNFQSANPRELWDPTQPSMGCEVPNSRDTPAGSPMFSHFVDDCSTAENESTKSFRGWCVQRTANLAWEHEHISKCMQWTKKTDDLNRNNKNVFWPTCRWYDWDDFTKKNKDIYDLRMGRPQRPVSTKTTRTHLCSEGWRFFGDG